MSDDQQLECSRRKEALQEYYFAQQIIDNFDARSLQIKSWSVTTSGVAIGVAFIESTPDLLVLGTLSALLFWYIDAMWKSFQRIAIERSAQIEQYLTQGIGSYDGPGWASHFELSFSFRKKLTRFSSVFVYTNTALPHLLIVLAGIVTFLDARGLLTVGLWNAAH